MKRPSPRQPSDSYPINWAKISPKTLPVLLSKALKTAQARLKALEAIPVEHMTFDLLLKADNLTIELDRLWGLAHHLAGVADSPAIRRVIETYTPQISQFYSQLGVNAKLWAQVQHIYSSREAKSLPPLHRRYLQLTRQGFIRSGAQLAPKEKKEWVKLDTEFSKLSNDYEKKILDSTKQFEKPFPAGSEKTALKGLPDSALAMGRSAAAAKGKKGYLYNLQGPSFMAIMTYADDEKLRKEFSDAAQQIGRGAPYNTEKIIRRMLQIRLRMAELMKFPNFAAYVVEKNMLSSPTKIKGFIQRLARHTQRSTLTDFRRMAELKKDMGHGQEFQPWDRAYYVEKLTEKELKLNTEELRPYFEFHRVLQSLFQLTERLFGVVCRPVKGHKAWHPGVHYYEMVDKKSKRLIGGFYTDFFPRESKHSGAWMDQLVTGLPTPTGQLSPHVGLICGNFTPPAKGLPSLLTHEEVLTFYHEFGHLLHGMLTSVPIRSLAGTNVPRDFVELPSQLLENYCHDKKYLSQLGRHYKTGKALPTVLINKLKKNQKFLLPFFVSRQLGLGTIDMTLHAANKVPQNIDKTLENALSPFRLPYATQPRTSWRNFGHLWGGGYAAGYYSYQWCNVLEADVWQYFERNGILSPKVGRAYREHILAKGNSEPVEDLYKNLMGRAPRLEAYMKRIKG